VPFSLRPDRLLVQVNRLIGIDGDGRGRGLAVPYQPCLAFEQVIVHALAVPDAVRVRFCPLIGILAGPQPFGGFPDKSAYCVQVPGHTKT
jgi:hypothetical protein